MPANSSGKWINKVLEPLTSSKATPEMETTSVDSSLWPLIKHKVISKARNHSSRRHMAHMAIINSLTREKKHLERNKPINGSVQWETAWCNVRAKLAEAEHSAGTLQKLQANANFNLKSEKTSKMFIGKHTSRVKTKSFSEVDTPQGVSNDPEVVSNAAETFYKELYQDEATSQSDDKLEKWLNIIPKGPELDIMKPITLEELKEVVKTLPRDKCPGPDGISYEFIIKNFKMIANPLLAHLNASLENGTPVHGSTTGYTVLLHKKGSRSSLANWRPITLLNVNYKLLSKVMSRRLNTYTPEKIHPAQYGFTPGRSIIDNIHQVANLARDALPKGAIVFLDQEKAYDRVSWKFLIASLRAHSFPETFIKWIEAHLIGSQI